MLKIDRQKQHLTRLETPTLADASITERYDLQEYICNSPEAFFEEIGQTLFLIAKEIQPSDDVEDRIDLLALDKEGQAVIIELKRGHKKLQMFQAIAYAGMVATCGEPDDAFQLPRRRQARKAVGFPRSRERGNQPAPQRIILIAEAFDYSVLVKRKNGSQRSSVSIFSAAACPLPKMPLANAEFLVCSNIFPAPELGAA